MIGDRCVSDDTGAVMQLPHPKIKKIGNSLIGGCGNLTPMAYILTLEKDLKKLDRASDLYAFIWNSLAPKIYAQLDVHGLRTVSEGTPADDLCDIFIVSQNRVFHMELSQTGFELTESNTPTAMGSGTPYWMASYTTLTQLDEANGVRNTKARIQERMQQAMSVTSNLVTHVDDNVDVITGGGIVDR